MSIAPETEVDPDRTPMPPSDTTGEPESTPAVPILPAVSESPAVELPSTESHSLIASWLPVGQPFAKALTSDLQFLERAATTLISGLPNYGTELADWMSIPEQYSRELAVTLIVTASVLTVRVVRPFRSARPYPELNLRVMHHGGMSLVQWPAT